MEENKNTAQDVANGIVVKDTDGTFKVLSDGELKEMDALLAATAQTIAPQAVTPPKTGMELDVPRFTDLAPMSKDPHFVPLEKTTKPGDVVEHHFHPEDKEDLERELAKLNTVFGIAPQKQYSVVKITEKVLEKHAIKLTTEEFAACVRLVASFFRQMRSVVETRAQLTRPKAEGGFGIASDTADHMLVVLKHLKDSIEEMDGTIVDVSVEPAVGQPVAQAVKQDSKTTVSVAPPASIQPVSAPEKPRPQSTVETPKKVESIPFQPAPAQIPTFTPPSQPHLDNPPVVKKEGISPQSQSEMAPVVKKETAPPQPKQTTQPSKSDALPKVNRPQVASTFKVPMIDVKRPQVNAVRSGAPIGRVEELALMDMATWRMLDPDPRIRAGKVLGKVQNLEQESLTRKSQGIQAWRSNEVYQHYLAIGQMSLEQKKDVAEVIQAIKANGQDTLNLDEFEAVSDLNRMLRF